MSNFVELKPLIYRVVARQGKGYNLRAVGDHYPIKKKLYGKVHKVLYRINRLIGLNLFELISIITTGGKGLGKTTSMNFLANLLLKNDIPIIEVKYIDVKTDLIEFLSDFRNVCIYIDEFGKYFTNKDQDKMLTLLNKADNHYKIFMLGENHKQRISDYILDRMERTRYHLDLNRIDNPDLLEYCSDNELPEDITKNLIDINTKSSSISYDTLEILVQENKIFPELDFDELTSIMNCQGILGVAVIEVLDVQIESKDWYITNFTEDNNGRLMTYANFTSNGSNECYLRIDLNKYDDSSEVENTTKSPMLLPTAQNGERTINTSVNSSHIIEIDDALNRLTLKKKMSVNWDKSYEFELTVIIGSKIVPKESVGQPGRFRY